MVPGSLLAAPEAAVTNLDGCTAESLAANDDGSSGLESLPFPVEFFGTTYNNLYINNNGNVTFDNPLGTFTPFDLTAITPPIIAPFFADVDTRGGGSKEVTWGTVTWEGRQAFCVNWVDVGYYNQHTDKTNSFQLLLVDRSGAGGTDAGDFDIILNYDRLSWETGDASGGSGGLGGTSAAAGYSSGSDGTSPADGFYTFPGSLVNGGLLDSNPSGLANTSTNSPVTGRHILPVRNGIPNPGETGCTISGTAGDDVLTGTAGDDVICGLEGNDQLFGLDGQDTLLGGPGNDAMDGGAGADELRGGDGDDPMFGGAGDDQLFGEAGVDRLRGGTGNDGMDGGAGNDLLFGEAGNDRLFGEAGNDRLFGQDGLDRLLGGAGDDLADGGAELDDVRGGPGNDTVDGNQGPDDVQGEDGNDRVLGGEDPDRLRGGPGNDALDGGPADDRCDGGSEVDTAVNCEEEVDIP